MGCGGSRSCMVGGEAGRWDAGPAPEFPTGAPPSDGAFPNVNTRVANPSSGSSSRSRSGGGAVGAPPPATHFPGGNVCSEGCMPGGGVREICVVGGMAPNALEANAPELALAGAAGVVRAPALNTGNGVSSAASGGIASRAGAASSCPSGAGVEGKKVVRSESPSSSCQAGAGDENAAP